MMVSRLFIFAALILATIPHAVDLGSFNRVPSGPREPRPAGWIPARGALPTRLNECVILNRARYSPTHVWPQSLLPGYQQAAPFDEQVNWSRLDCGVRVFVNAPATLTARPRVLIVYATPNANTIIHELVETLAKEVSAERIVLTCHSGGGSFIFGYMNAFESLPPALDRIVFLDANYSYSDDVFAAAQVKLDPKPLTKDRDTVATFWQHHQIIEEQMRGKSRGLLVAGIKKDVVLTNRLKEKPHKVAIYSWHESSSQPIQSLYVGHVDWYVDYSHGVRLMSQQIVVDNQLLKVSDVLKDSHLCPLLSTEGPIDVAEVRNAAGWGR